MAEFGVALRGASREPQPATMMRGAEPAEIAPLGYTSLKPLVCAREPNKFKTMRVILAAGWRAGRQARGDRSVGTTDHGTSR